MAVVDVSHVADATSLTIDYNLLDKNAQRDDEELVFTDEQIEAIRQIVSEELKNNFKNMSVNIGGITLNHDQNKALVEAFKRIAPKFSI